MTCLAVVERVFGMIRQGVLRELSCACQQAPQLWSMFLVLALVVLDKHLEYLLHEEQASYFVASVRELGLTV